MKFADIVEWLKKLGILRYGGSTYNTAKGDEYDPLAGEFYNSNDKKKKESHSEEKNSPKVKED
jgi:hypothetical protein